MIQLTYRRHVRGTDQRDGTDIIAHFPTYKACCILLALWNQSQYLYEVMSLAEVGTDPSKFHADCNHYAHLVK